MEREWLIMLMPYFGRWPEWINLFIESCRWNPDVRWRFYTDCGEPENKADNVDYVHLSQTPTVAILRLLRPRYYAKGDDWRDRLPADELDVCSAQTPRFLLASPTNEYFTS